MNIKLHSGANTQAGYLFLKRNLFWWPAVTQSKLVRCASRANRSLPPIFFYNATPTSQYSASNVPQSN